MTGKEVPGLTTRMAEVATGTDDDEEPPAQWKRRTQKQLWVAREANKPNLLGTVVK